VKISLSHTRKIDCVDPQLPASRDFLYRSITMNIPVSVIIPHYNRPDRIERAIASVRSQTVQPAEIVLVDDLSRPECREELRRFEGIAKIVWLPANRGSANARNEGVRACQCDTVAFLDDDDEWLPTKLERQWAVLEANPGLAASTTAILVVDNRSGEKLGEMHRESAPAITLPMALEATPAMNQTLMIRKSAFLALGGFDPGFRNMQDHDFMIRLALAKLSNCHLAEPLSRYRVGNADQVTKNWKRMLRARLAVIEKHRSLYEQVFGPGGARLARGAHLRWAGARHGGFQGRTAFAYGAWLGHDWGAIVRLALTCRMCGPDYSRLHGGPAEQPFR
jgi:glycosyltransferase involved in cell wall biosynthesis